MGKMRDRFTEQQHQPAPQPDLFGARSARDEALSRVLDHAGDDWTGIVLERIRALPLGWSGTAEALRLRLLGEGCPKPPHHNAWGAVIRRAGELDLIMMTGELEAMRTRKSHARRSPVWRRGL